MPSVILKLKSRTIMSVKRTTPGYRRIASLATQEDIIYHIEHDKLEFTMNDAANICGRLNIDRDSSSAMYVAALYFNGRLIETSFSVDTFEDITSHSKTVMTCMFIRAYLRTRISRYVGGNTLSETEEHGLRRGLYKLLLDLLPTRYGIEVPDTDDKYWRDTLDWMLHQIGGTTSDLRYTRSLKGASYAIYRGLRYNEQQRKAMVVTRLVFTVKSGLGDTANVDPFSEKSQYTTHLIEPVDCVTNDYTLDRYAQQIWQTLTLPHMDIGLQSYTHRDRRTR
ncbi:hypothetical protein O8H94_001065 [Escherichia coli O157]|nr:hypothetical protein [Escherichia coli O157]